MFNSTTVKTVVRGLLIVALFVALREVIPSPGFASFEAEAAVVPTSVASKSDGPVPASWVAAMRFHHQFGTFVGFDRPYAVVISADADHIVAAGRMPDDTCLVHSVYHDLNGYYRGPDRIDLDHWCSFRFPEDEAVMRNRYSLPFP